MADWKQDLYNIRHAFRDNCKLTIRKVRLDRGGYDSDGRYFGIGAPLFIVSNEKDEETDDIKEVYIRASDKEAAKKYVKEHNPSYRV